MSTLNDKYPSLLDVSKQFTENGQPLPIAEMLVQDNPILDDIPYMEGNLTTGHRISLRTGQPTAAFRKLNQGTAVSKSQFATMTEACGELVAWGDVDQKLAELNGNTAAFRMNQNRGHIESLGQTWASTVFYGNTDIDPEKFTGLSPRFNSLSTGTSGNVITGGGSSACTSLWLIGWAPHTVYGIYPKGSKAGLVHDDLGLDTVLDASSNPYRAYRDRFVMDGGIAVQDWRYIVRIPNIDSSALTKNAGSGADLIDLMTQALEKVYSLNGVRPVFYANRTITGYLRRQIVNKVANSTLSMDSVGGKPVLSFCEVPVHRCDALLNTETAVS